MHGVPARCSRDDLLDPINLLWILLPVAAASGWYVARRSAKQAATGEGPGGLRSDYFKGINYLLNEQPDKAIEIFIKVLEVDTETVETHLALGNLYRRRGEVDRAIRIHQNLIARTNLSVEQRNEALLELGQDYLSAGLLDRAENLFKELTQAPTYREQALRQLVDIYEQEKDWAQAIDTARELGELTGKRQDAVIAHYYCERAITHKQEGNAPAVLEQVHAALASNSGCVRASLLEGDALSDLGDFRGAIDAYKRVEEQDPDYVPEAVARMRRCFDELELSDELQRYLSRVLQRYGWITALLALAEMKLETHGRQAAVDFIASELEERASVRALDRLLEIELESSGGERVEHLHLLKRITTELVSGRPVYKCTQCGFPGKSMHWQCPSCKHWDTVKPIQGIEGE